MKLKILFFGALVDITGASSQELQLDDIKTITLLNKHFQSIYPDLGKHKYKIAVNQKIIEGEINLEEGDEVAFLPPFAGG